MAPKFKLLTTLLGLTPHTNVRLSISGRYITVKFYSATKLTATYKVSDNCYWEAK